MLRSPRGSAPRAFTTRAPARELCQLDDAALLDAISEGDEPAFGELFVRYADTVRRFARRTYGATSDADDLVAEAFFRVLQSTRRGGGRIEHPQAYLLTVARRIAMEWSRRRRDLPVDDDELAGRLEPAADRTAGSVERHLIARAFANLPERWRSVLWRVEVEGERPSVVGAYLGLSANATAALARRARAGLRAAYLQAHLADRAWPVSCRSVVTKLGGFTYGSVRGAERRRIRRHLAGCESCAALHAELADVCSGLRAHAGHVGPLLGAGTAAHHLATGSTWPFTSGSASVGSVPAGSVSAGSVSAGSVSVGKAALGSGGKLAALVGRTKLAIAATATAGVGVLGVVGNGAWHGDAGSQAFSGYGGGRGDQVRPVCTSCASGTRAAPVSGSTTNNPATHHPATHHPSTNNPARATRYVAATTSAAVVGAKGTRPRNGRHSRVRRAGPAGTAASRSATAQRATTFDGGARAPRAGDQPMTASQRSAAPGVARVRSSKLPAWIPPSTRATGSAESGTEGGPTTAVKPSTPDSTHAGSTKPGGPEHGPSGASSERSTATPQRADPGAFEQRADPATPGATAQQPSTTRAANPAPGTHPYQLRSGHHPGATIVRIHVALLTNRP